MFSVSFRHVGTVAPAAVGEFVTAGGHKLVDWPLPGDGVVLLLVVSGKPHFKLGGPLIQGVGRLASADPGSLLIVDLTDREEFLVGGELWVAAELGRYPSWPSQHAVRQVLENLPNGVREGMVWTWGPRPGEAAKGPRPRPPRRREWVVSF